jgi:hypothetical protein
MLPGEVLLNRQRILLTSFVESENSAAHGCHNGRLPIRRPPLGSRRRQWQTGHFDLAYIRTCNGTGTAVDGRFAPPRISSSQFLSDSLHDPLANSKGTICLEFIFDRGGKYSRC